MKAGPSLMFITLPKVLHSMGFATVFGALFFLLVLFAALTSAIALAECAVATFCDELHISRLQATAIMAVIVIAFGTLSTLGYGPLANFTLFGMQMLDFFDFLTNSLMMPISAIFICILILRYITIDGVEQEMTKHGGSFRRKGVFSFMIKYVCIVFLLVILISSIATVLGVISI